ncbi:hypothetical protein [Donghicola mangrovi]|uniref:Uncharacterized protein n=1 Tax=Donghicola mangrovi TaxID=2729614 RepID=A0A850Q7M5_9RHOB|nr:hypothetical protein [Donghicola mangrovi]NVO24943.1 hypothetical protein [Donghicola mangrovi]
MMDPTRYFPPEYATQSAFDGNDNVCIGDLAISIPVRFAHEKRPTGFPIDLLLSQRLRVRLFL